MNKRLLSLLAVAATGLAGLACVLWLLPRSTAPEGEAPGDRVALGPGSLPAGTTSAPAPEPTALAAPTPGQLRELIAFTRAADLADAPRLRRLALGTVDSLVAGNALRALGRLGATAGDPQLLELLSDPRVRVRQELVRAIGRSGDPLLAARLQPALRDPGTRPLAIQALGRLGGEDARGMLAALDEEAEMSEVDRTFLRTALADLGRSRRVPVRPDPGREPE